MSGMGHSLQVAFGDATWSPLAAVMTRHGKKRNLRQSKRKNRQNSRQPAG